MNKNNEYMLFISSIIEFPRLMLINLLNKGPRSITISYFIYATNKGSDAIAFSYIYTDINNNTYQIIINLNLEIIIKKENREIYKSNIINKIGRAHV